MTTQTTQNDDTLTVDLHAHTTASDGDHTPTELIAHANEKGLTAIAVTDHDTTAGIAEAIEAGKRYGVEVIPGIELSAEVEAISGIGRGQCHILGLFIDPNHAGLLARLAEVVRNRNTRNARIVEKLNALGFSITLADVEAEAGGREEDGAIIARPHFARLLVNRFPKEVPSMQFAFDEYLAKGGKAYVERDRLTPQEAIDLIHASGGVAILAHPNNLEEDRKNPPGYGRDDARIEAEIRKLQEWGLDGIEARYNRHTPEDNAHYLALADRLGMVTSGGSDFHGPTVKAKVILSDVENGHAAPYSVLEKLKARRQERLAQSHQS